MCGKRRCEFIRLIDQPRHQTARPHEELGELDYSDPFLAPDSDEEEPLEKGEGDGSAEC